MSQNISVIGSHSPVTDDSTGLHVQEHSAEKIAQEALSDAPPLMTDEMDKAREMTRVPDRDLSEETLAKMDTLFRDKLNPAKHPYVFLSDADIAGDMARDARGRRNALVTWAERARAAGADMIIVPQVITMQERVGGKAGVVSAAAVNEDFYLIDARDPVTLVMRSHFAEEQKPLTSDITKIGTFFRRGGSWLTALELAAEGMDKAVEEFGL